MLIDCPGCGKSYHIIKAALGSSGRRVACPRCDAIWFVGLDGSANVAAPELAEDLAANDLAFTAEISLAAGDYVHFAKPTELVLPPADVKKPRAAVAITRRRQPSGLLACVAVVTLGMALIGFRSEMVRLWPRAATAYTALGLPVNLRGLGLENFHTVTLNDGYQSVLGVEGEITNLRAQPIKLPSIRLAIRDGDGRRLYSWVVSAQKPRLAPGETVLFRTRLAAPPAAGRDILVDFTPAPPTALAALWRRVWRF
jgi:predicted Zn finger-like uncharacterized protein